MIVPTSAASHRVKRIVVGVDGSTGSAAAVAFCATLAPLLTANVVAVYADEPFAEWISASATRSWHRSAEVEVRRWVAPIEDKGVPVAVDVDRDIHPIAALCRAIEAEADTLAVVGTRGLGGISGMRLGRIPIQLVHHTGAAVVMVPPGEASRDAPPPHDPEIRRIYDDERTEAGNRVLVDRLWPRGVKKEDAALDEWLKDAAPSTELRRWYGHDPGRFAEFSRRYRAELRQPPASDAVDHLITLSARHAVILLTATGDVEHSAAGVLQDHLRLKNRRPDQRPRAAKPPTRAP